MKIGTMYLFPLVQMDRYLDGYYMDATGEVYSQRRSATPVRMAGTRTSSGIYLTLNKRSFNKTDLQRRAMTLPAFKRETSASAPTLAATVMSFPEALKVSERDHASSLAEGISKRGYVLAKVQLVGGEEALLFGSKPTVHTTLKSADAELTRLATLNPGVKYVKLKIEGGLVLGGLTRL